MAASGTPQEVLRAYHRHLAARAPVYVDRPETAAPRRRRPGCGAVAGDLTIRSPFIGGQPAADPVLAADPSESAEFTLSFRDNPPQLVAARTHPAVALRAGIPEALRQHLETLPFRDGVYRIDLAVVADDGEVDAIDAVAERQRLKVQAQHLGDAGAQGHRRGACAPPPAAPRYRGRRA